MSRKITAEDIRNLRSQPFTQTPLAPIDQSIRPRSATSALGLRLASSTTAAISTLGTASTRDHGQRQPIIEDVQNVEADEYVTLEFIIREKPPIKVVREFMRSQLVQS